MYTAYIIIDDSSHNCKSTHVHVHVSIPLYNFIHVHVHVHGHAVHVKSMEHLALTVLGEEDFASTIAEPQSSSSVPTSVESPQAFLRLTERIVYAY